jgi:hypothetical protein
MVQKVKHLMAATRKMSMKQKAFNFFSRYRGLTFTLTLLLGVVLQVQAAAPPPDLNCCDKEPCREFTKNIAREFATTANGMTALYNRYGKVDVKTWSENKVKININIVVNAGSESNANRVFDKINVNFTNTQGYIKAETMIGDMGWNWGQNSDFKINYEVWMPVGNALDLQNKYGNSFVANLNGKLLAEIKYGDLRTENINADADVLIEYGNASIASVQYITGEVGYGGLKIDNAREIQIDSRYSDLSFRNANQVRLTSKYDDLSFGIIENLRLQTKHSEAEIVSVKTALVTAQYTDIQMETLTGTFDADLKYCELNIQKLSSSFQSANITGSYTDVDIALGNQGIKFDIAGTYTDINLPSTNNCKRTESGNLTTSKGSVGNAKGSLVAKLSYGDITLK